MSLYTALFSALFSLFQAASAATLGGCLPQRESSTKYLTTPMLTAFWGDDIKDRIPYFTESVKNQTKVTVRDGLLYKSDGEPLTQHDGMYVMDKNGQFYTLPTSKKVPYHHSTFMAGKPVAAAGLISVKNGRLVSIDNASGHYQPPTRFFRQALDSLVWNGADITGVKIGLGGNAASGSERSSETAIQFLFKGPQSVSCIDSLLENPKDAHASVFRALHELDPAKLESRLRKIDQSGQIDLYQESLQEFFEGNKKYIRILSRKNQKKFSVGLKACVLNVVSKLLPK